MSRQAGPDPRQFPAQEVDARGLRCPLPVLRLAAALRHAPPGSIVVLLATDPATRVDVPAFARMRELEVVEIVDRGDHTAYVLRGPQPDGRSHGTGGAANAPRSNNR